ncbi:MAG: YidC/Oxa1 family membrane protein insertase [Lachnospiraceae bacterium]
MSEIILTAYNGKILGPIAIVLGYIMDFIYNLLAMVGIENISLTIIIFTIVIYMCLFPVTYNQQKFSKLTQKMQPELQVVQKKYKGKKDQASMQAMQAETKVVYEKYGVSPTGSCVFMLINMPILLALYRVFYNIPAYIGSVKEKFMPLVDSITSTSGYQETMETFVEDMNLQSLNTDFTVTDMDTVSNYIVDVLYRMNSSGWEVLKSSFTDLSSLITKTQEDIAHVSYFFGLNISDTPLSIIQTNFAARNFLMIFVALLIPVISYLTQVMNIKLMPQTAAPADDNNAMANQMKTMNKIMPLFSLVFCFTVPVGLGIYWIASALVRSIQQYLLNRHFDKMNLEDIIMENQKKAKKKREKKGVTQSQINSAAKINTKKIEDPASEKMSEEDKKSALQAAEEKRKSAKSGSMASKANMVKDFNEKMNK